jgi:hypothetical protein
MNKVINNRFSECLDIEKIRAKVTVRPEPVVALGSVDALIASEQLASALKQIFIPNEFSLAFIKEMAGRASVHSQLLFKSEADYASKIFNPPEVEVSPVCLSSLSHGSSRSWKKPNHCCFTQGIATANGVFVWPVRRLRDLGVTLVCECAG